MAPWEQDFVAYMAMLDEVVGSFLLDLNTAHHAPLATHQARVQVRVTLKDAGEAGLPNPAELDELSSLEDRLVESLVTRFGVIFVGSIVSDGLLHLVCYAEADKVSAPETILEGFDPEGYEVAWFVEDDPEWGMYFEFLYPDPVSQQTIQNRRLLAVLAENGDDPTQVRQVDHTAYFEDRAAAGAAGRALEAKGFVVQEATDEGEHWSLGFHREDALDEERTDEFSIEIMETLAPYEGRYEGWGAPVKRATH